MNKIVTSKEEILQTSRKLIQQQGWSAVSIRSVAAACDVSVGSIYNYFDSKTDLVNAIIESVWREIFHKPEDMAIFTNAENSIKWIYERMAYGSQTYPGFFTLHSISYLREDKSDGVRRMQHAWHHIILGITEALKHDTNVRPDAFNDEFTAEKFAEVLFSQVVSSLLQQNFDPSIVLVIIHKVLY